MVATRCARLRRAGDRRVQMVATRCARLRRAGDRHELRVNPVGPGRRTMAP